MKRPPGCRLVVVAACLALAHGAARGQSEITAETLTDQDVREAIDTIVEELYGRMDPRHYWDPRRWSAAHGSVKQGGGYTAIVVLALLHAGESYQSPRLRGAVRHLERASLEGSYATAVRAIAWAKLPPKFMPKLEADTRWLLDAFSPEVGGWSYDRHPPRRRQDNSIRQYGALALWEAAKRGVRVDRRSWRQLEAALLDCQREDGGWNYQSDAEPSTGSMTTAGLATLFITQDFLHADAAVALGTRRPTRAERAIEHGLAWMNDNFSVVENPGSFRYDYYYLFGVERVGIASGRKYFGGRDWYREGAAELIHRLCGRDDGLGTMKVHARERGVGNGSIIRNHHLAFALMFLSRGRVPVAFNKLRIPDHRWNNRPRDAANLTRWITAASETDLNWQIVGLEAEPEEWLDAPILYLASDRALPWASGPANASPPNRAASPELDKLRRYLDLGGLLFAANEGSNGALTASLERLGRLMYPAYEWRTLPPDHWAYTIHGHVPGAKPALRALSNGVRELIILAPGRDLPASFQARSPGEATHFQLGANIFFYASELNRPRPRLAAHVYEPADADRASRTASVVRAIYGGNWNPEPLALETFRAYLASEHGIDLRIADRPLDGIADLDPRPALVVVSGTEAHEFTEEERRAIRRYVDGGGVIVLESAGGRGAFAASAEIMAAELFDLPVRSVLREPMISGAGVEGLGDLSRIEYRPFSFEVFGSRDTTPRLRGIRIDGQARVLFSREDISHALLDQPCWGISGYAPASARALLANIVRYALHVAEP